MLEIRQAPAHWNVPRVCFCVRFFYVLTYRWWLFLSATVATDFVPVKNDQRSNMKDSTFCLCVTEETAAVHAGHILQKPRGTHRKTHFCCWHLKMSADTSCRPEESCCLTGWLKYSDLQWVCLMSAVPAYCQWKCFLQDDVCVRSLEALHEHFSSSVSWNVAPGCLLLLLLLLHFHYSIETLMFAGHTSHA